MRQKNDILEHLIVPYRNCACTYCVYCISCISTYGSGSLQTFWFSIIFTVFILKSQTYPHSIPFSQFLRLRRLCSDDNDFFNKYIEIRSFSINRQYPAAIIDRAMNKAFSTDRTTALTPKTRAASDRIPFTITFHPVNNSIKPIVNLKFKVLNSDSSTSNISVNASFFLSRKIAIFALFRLQEQYFPIKNLVLFVVPANDV